MRPLAAIALGTMLLALQPPSAAAQEASADLLLEVMDRRARGLADVDLYLKVVNSLGPQISMPDSGVGMCAQKVCQGMAVVHGEIDDEHQMAAELPQSPEQMAVRAGVASSVLLSAMGHGLITAQEQLNTQVFGMDPDSARLSANLQRARYEDTPFEMKPFCMLGDGGSDCLPPEWIPFFLLGFSGVMALNAADAITDAAIEIQNTGSRGQSEINDVRDMLNQFRADGREDYNGIEVVRYNFDYPEVSGAPDTSDDPDSNDQGGAEEPEFTGGYFLVDPANLRMMKQRFEGTMAAEGETRDFFVEIEFSDFRNPSGCGQMDQPFRRTTRMGGMLNDEEMEQMEEAREQLAEFEQQLASMPADQRALIERTMGSQMARMRSLVNSGNFEYVEETEQVLCNPDLESLFDVAGNAPAIAALESQESEADLIRRIQEYLVILGYEPGNIDGVLDDLTIVAISQFQAEEGLEVTGEPSQALAVELYARVASL